MKRLTWFLAAMALMMTSCNKDLFDKNTYEGLVDYQFMIDNTDPEHDWCLTKRGTIVINAPENRIYSVQLLTDNPYVSTKAEIIAEAVCYGYRAELTYTIPVTLYSFYVAALTDQGEYLGVAPVTSSTTAMEITTSALQKSNRLNTPSYQTFTYLYESTFPMPDDFDFNDMVLRINMRHPNLANSLVIDLTVTLEAAGAGELYGAAIQLADIDYNDISSVEIVDGEQMDKGYPLQRLFITSEKPLLKGRRDEAVINLFECAQWSLKRQLDDLGDVAIIRYNTSKIDQNNYSEMIAPVTTTYRITFKDRDKARLLTFDRIDPFIIHQNTNGGIWEVHTYAHKFDETLWSCFNGQASVYDNHISWALVIPKADFRYPTEGLSMSNFNSRTGEIFGPYPGFVSWLQSHTSNRDWYTTVADADYVY